VLIIEYDPNLYLNGFKMAIKLDKAILLGANFFFEWRTVLLIIGKIP